jgi:hypothetical protein
MKTELFKPARSKARYSEQYKQERWNYGTPVAEAPIGKLILYRGLLSRRRPVTFAALHGNGL